MTTKSFWAGREITKREKSNREKLRIFCFGFRVLSSGFRVQGSGFRVLGITIFLLKDTKLHFGIRVWEGTIFTHSLESGGNVLIGNCEDGKFNEREFYRKGGEGARERKEESAKKFYVFWCFFLAAGKSTLLRIKR